MEWLSLIGRIVFGLYFVFMGINHFVKYQGLKGYAAFKNLPAPGLSIIITGIVLLVGGLSILTSYYVFIALIALAIFLVLAAFTIHNFWTMEDENAKAAEMSQFFKNLAIAAACLMFL